MDVNVVQLIIGCCPPGIMYLSSRLPPEDSAGVCFGCLDFRTAHRRVLWWKEGPLLRIIMAQHGAAAALLRP